MNRRPLQDFHFILWLLPGHRRLLLIVSIIVSATGKESMAECGLRAAQAHRRSWVWPKIPWKSGQTTQQASHPHVPSEFRKWNRREAGGRRAQAGHVCPTKCHGNSPTTGVRKGHPCLARAPSPLPHFHPEIPTSPQEGKSKECARHTQLWKKSF